MRKITLLVSFALASLSLLHAENGIKDNNILSPESIGNLSLDKPTQQKTFLNVKGSGGDAFQEGNIAITLGYGFPNLGKSIVKYLTSDSSDNVKATGFGPLHLKAEYGLSNKIGIGISVNYITYGLQWTNDGYISTTGARIPYSYEVKFASLSILGRFNIHFATTDKLDPYWGIGAGYKTGKWTYKSNDPDFGKDSFKSPIPFGFETTIGMRYYFTDMIGVYAEIGIAKSIIQGGIAIKL